MNILEAMPHIKEHKERGAISKKQQHNSTGYHNVDMINEEHAKSEIVMNFMLFLSILDFFFMLSYVTIDVFYL